MESPATRTGDSESAGFLVRAEIVGDRIDLRRLMPATRLALTPPALPVGRSGVAVLFRYGAVVFFDVTPDERGEFIATIRPQITPLTSMPEVEEVRVRIDPDAREGMEANAIVLSERSIERMQVVADILAKSVILAMHEANITRTIERIEPLAVNLKRRGRSGRSTRELLSHIGDSLLAEHQMLGRVEVADKPELLWERPVLERLYLRLEEEFEIRERHLALDRKLDLISRTATTLLNLLYSRSTLRVEWYIVILILIEIVLGLVRWK